MIGIIAAVTKNGIMGVDNQLPFNYPEDLSHFRKTTADSIVIMGRNTYDSIGKPLPKRRNIVVTSKKIESVETANSLSGAIDLCINDNRPIWLIGGSSIYEEGMLIANKIILTITPDLEVRNPAVRFPWINPTLFKLQSLEPLGEGKLIIATYKK